MKRIASLGLVAAFVTSSFAQLDPVGGPGWWTHPAGPTTRLQYHSFMSDPNLNIAPDYTDNGFIPAIPDQWNTVIVPAIFLGQNPLYGDGHGTLVLPGTPFRKRMGNLFRPTWEKEWFVQIVWTTFPNSAGVYVPPALNVNAPGTVIGGGPGTNTQIVPGTGAGTMPFFVTSWRGLIKPQPELEVFDFRFENPSDPNQHPYFVDSVFIGTRCVPEPATMATMGIGLAAAAIRRRKARKE